MRNMILPLLLLGAATASIGAKKPLDHNSFDSWKEAVNHSFSRNGRWCAFSVNPQEGDGLLTFYDTRSGKRIDIERGYRPAFTADGKWGVALIKPWFENTRQARIDKKKDFDLPQDSLALIDLASGKIQKIADVLSYRLGKEGGDWIAYLSCDTTYISPADLKDKKAGKPLVVRRLGQETGQRFDLDRRHRGNPDTRHIPLYRRPRQTPFRPPCIQPGRHSSRLYRLRRLHRDRHTPIRTQHI